MENVKELIAKYGPLETFYRARDAARKFIYAKQGREISFSEPREGDIPTIYVVGRTLPEVWANTTMALMGIGQTVRTGYDPVDKDGRYISYPSMEASVMMHIQELRGEPRFHKAYLGGWKGLGDYIAEIEGVKDEWMISSEIVADMIKKRRFNEIKDNKKWKYTYHQRLTAYPFIDIEGNPKTINQLDSVVNKLTREPLSKSAQAITWDPRWDHNDGQMGTKWEDYDSPCLQRFWFRLIPNEQGYILNVNTHWRSRDHAKGVPMNIIGISEGIIEPMRKRLEDAIEKPIALGRYVDINDSLHLYGHYYDVAKQGSDAEHLLHDIFRMASGSPIEEMVIMPGTIMHNVIEEEVQKEYQFRKANPNFGRDLQS